MSAPVDTTAQATSQVPPQHPSSATGASVNPKTNPEVNATATGPAIAGNAGQPTAGGGGGLQDKIKGVFGMVHGSGEAIRGTTNSTLDQIGEAIAGRSSTSTSGTDPAPPTRSEGGTGRTPADVVGAGSDEFKAGLGAFRRN